VGDKERGHNGWLDSEAGLWQLVPAVVKTIINHPPLESPVHGPKQTTMLLGVRDPASKTCWGSRGNMITLSCILFLMLIQGTRYSVFVLCSFSVSLHIAGPGKQELVWLIDQATDRVRSIVNCVLRVRQARRCHLACALLIGFLGGIHACVNMAYCC
jgi:hypothetical protein